MRSKLRVLPYVALLLPLDVVVAFGLMAAATLGALKRGGTRGEKMGSVPSRDNEGTDPIFPPCPPFSPDFSPNY